MPACIMAPFFIGPRVMTYGKGDGRKDFNQSKQPIGDRELCLMNSRAREWLLRYWDFPLFASMMGHHHVHLRNAAVLEAGCGSGYSTLMIHERFHPRSLDAFDLDPGQVELARTRGIAARFFVGDVTNTHLDPSLYDAVFVCGVLHHCPNWRAGIGEVARLLKGGGLLFLEEPTRPFVRFEKCIIGSSPANESWRGVSAVRTEMPSAGLAIVEERLLYFGLFRSLMCVKMVGRPECERTIASILLRSEAEELAHGQGVPA